MIGALVWLTCFIFLFFFAKSLGMLVAAEILCGIPWGESENRRFSTSGTGTKPIDLIKQESSKR